MKKVTIITLIILFMTFTAMTGDKESPVLDRNAPQSIETATFAMGCFWSPDALFGVLPGVVRTRVGYSGGELKDPGYYHLGDHTETVQVDYDPQAITYKDLLNEFWNHSSYTRNTKGQYASIIFYHNAQQKELAEKQKKELEARTQSNVYVNIAPFRKFYMAEDYHQKYRLQQEKAIIKEFRSIYPDFKDIISSTAAARVNGYLSGYGELSVLEKELKEIGLSESAQNTLLSIFKSRQKNRSSETCAF